MRLEGRGTAVNREVLVRPTNPYGAGHRTDIKIEAVAASARLGETPVLSARPVVVVVEVKGSWNAALEEDQRNQLAARYLPDVDTDAGVYVVGWYPLQLWTDSRDRRRGAASRREVAAVTAQLHRQADDIRSELGVYTCPVVLEVPRPHPIGEPSG